MIDWMNWTPTVVIFFAVIASILAFMTVYEIVSPCRERKGFLPIETTRGDRLFIGLLSAAYIHLTFLAVSDVTLWVALAVSVAWLGVLLRWG
jgi:predicted small integral membrane protein